MKQRLAVWGCAWAIAAGAQTNLLDLAMPDARLLMGINVERVRAFQPAQALWSQAQSSERELAELTRLTGFDPLRDLDEVLIASAGGSKPNVLFAARGAFGRTDLAAVARGKIAGRETYLGVEILLTEEKQGEPMALAFLDATLLLAGDPASVRGAIARHSRGGLPGGELRRAAEQLMARFDAWGVSVVPVEELAARAPKEPTAGILAGEVMKAIERAEGGVRLNDAIELELTTVSRTEQDAVNLANALRFFAGLWQAREPAAASYLRDLSVEGKRMRLAMTIPAGELARMMALLGRGGPVRGTKPAESAETGVTIYSSPSDMGVVKIPGPGKPR